MQPVLAELHLDGERLAATLQRLAQRGEHRLGALMPVPHQRELVRRPGQRRPHLLLARFERGQDRLDPVLPLAQRDELGRDPAERHAGRRMARPQRADLVQHRRHHVGAQPRQQRPKPARLCTAHCPFLPAPMDAPSARLY